MDIELLAIATYPIGALDDNNTVSLGIKCADYFDNPNSVIFFCPLEI